MQKCGEFVRRTFLASFGLMFAAGLVMFAAGCGGGPTIEIPPLAKVTGKITIDGQPGADLMVTFVPDGKESAGSATGTTDAGGAYELKFRGQQPGAVVGKNIVRIERAAGGGPAGGVNAVPTTPLPAKYNSATTLSANVEEGENDIPFELTSK